MADQILEEQHKQAVEFNQKNRCYVTDLNWKFEALNIHVKKLDTHEVA